MEHHKQITYIKKANHDPQTQWFIDRDEMRRTFEGKRRVRRQYNMVILGGEDVGKSAVFKSFKALGNEQFDPVETSLEILETIHWNRSNCVETLIHLLKQSQILYESYDEKTNNDANLLKCLIERDDNNIAEKIELVSKYSSETFKDTASLNWDEIKELGEAMHFLWNLPQIQQTYRYKYKMKVYATTNIDFFMNKLWQLMTPNYVQMTGIKDFLYCKIRTTGFVQTTLSHTYGDDICHVFDVFDVGGERAYRKNWINIFYKVSAVIFVCALDQYCLSIFTDPTQNAMLENLEIFDIICNGKWFQSPYTQIVLLFVRCDLFEKALVYTPLGFCFGDEYKGKNVNDFYNLLLYVLGQYEAELNIIIPIDVKHTIDMFLDGPKWWLQLCYQDGVAFIKDKYVKLNRNPNKDILVFETIATDHAAMQKVWWDIQQTVKSKYKEDLCF